MKNSKPKEVRSASQVGKCSGCLTVPGHSQDFATLPLLSSSSLSLKAGVNWDAVAGQEENHGPAIARGVCLPAYL